MVRSPATASTTTGGQQHHHHHHHQPPQQPPGGGEAGGEAEGEEVVPADVREYDIYGCLFKRRGGTVGRYLGWKPRVFTLHQGFLCYYEGEIIEEVDRYKPRGVFRVGGHNAKGAKGSVTFSVQEPPPQQQQQARAGGGLLYAPSDPSAPPTEYLLWLVSPNGEHKWKLCAPSKEDYDDWVRALAVYLGEPSVNAAAGGSDAVRRGSLEILGGSSSHYTTTTAPAEPDTDAALPSSSTITTANPVTTSSSGSSLLRLRKRSTGDQQQQQGRGEDQQQGGGVSSSMLPVVGEEEEEEEPSSPIARGAEPAVIISPLHTSGAAVSAAASTTGSSQQHHMTRRTGGGLLPSTPSSIGGHSSSSSYYQHVLISPPTSPGGTSTSSTSADGGGYFYHSASVSPISTRRYSSSSTAPHRARRMSPATSADGGPVGARTPGGGGGPAATSSSPGCYGGPGGYEALLASPPLLGHATCHLDRREVLGALLLINLVLMLVRSGGPGLYTAITIVTNLAARWLLVRSQWLVPGGSVSRAVRWETYRFLDEKVKPILLRRRWRPPSTAQCYQYYVEHRRRKGGEAAGGNGGEGGSGSSGSSGKRQTVRFGIPKVPSRMPPIGTTVLKAPPIAITEAATTLDATTAAGLMPPHSYCPISAANLRVRSATYRHDGRKEPSSPAMYELLHFDLYRSPHRLNHVASLMTDLPSAMDHLLPHRLPNSTTSSGKAGGPEALVLPPHVPRLLVINWQAPCDAPSILASEDGPGYSCVFYFGITEATATALRPLLGTRGGDDGEDGATTTTATSSAGGAEESSSSSSVPPHIRLLSDYFRLAPDSLEWKGRLKCIAHCRNLKELGLPSFIDKCNGKPVLLNKSVTIIRGKGYVQLDINMHRFGYPARKGLHYLNEKFKDLSFLMGFVIEGRADEELPEVLLGLGHFNKIDLRRAVPLAYYNDNTTTAASSPPTSPTAASGDRQPQQQQARTSSVG